VKYRLMTHTQQFNENGVLVTRQLALDANDAAHWFTAEKIASLHEAEDDEVTRTDLVSQDPFAPPAQADSALDPQPMTVLAQVPAPEFGPGGPVVPPEGS
jgi:hypothetical protein